MAEDALQPPLETCRLRRIRRKFEIPREIDLDSMSFPNRDRRQTIQKPIHRLRAGLRCGLCGAARDDHGTIAVTAGEARGADELRQAADEPDSCGCAESGPVVVIDLVVQPCITDLVQANELVETMSASVGHQQTMEADGEARLTQR